jgi:hypothetical protein
MEDVAHMKKNSMVLGVLTLVVTLASPALAGEANKAPAQAEKAKKTLVRQEKKAEPACEEKLSTATKQEGTPSEACYPVECESNAECGDGMRCRLACCVPL